MSDADTLRMALPDFHSGHLAVLRERRILNFLAAGRGWKKSTLLLRLAVDAMSRKKNVLWGAPEEDNIDNVIMDQWQLFCGSTYWDKHFHSGKRLFQVPGWGWLQFRPLNKTRGSHGATPGRILIDEMGLLRNGVFAEIIQPMLSKDPDCDLWGVGTPNPDQPLNDFWEWVTADSSLPENRRIANWIVPLVGAKVNQDGSLERVPNAYESPDKTFDQLVQEWLEVRPSQRAMWRIQMLCEFISATGEGIQNVQRACRLLCEKGEKEGEYFRQGGVQRAAANGWYQGGVDIAYTPTGNWTVIVVIDRNTMEQVYFRRLRPPEKSERSRQAYVHDAIIRAYKLFPCKWYVDCTGVGGLAPEALRLAGCGNVEGFNLGGANRIKAEMVGHMHDLIEDNQLALFDLPIIVREMMGLKRKQEGDKVIYEAGKAAKDDRSELNDDIPLAVSFALRGVNPIPKIAVSPAFVPKPAGDPVATMAW